MKITRTAYQAAIVAVLINLAAGAQYCWSMLGKSMINEYGWTATEAALPYTVMMVVTSFWAIIAGKIGDYWKPKYGTMLGAICMGFGLIISGLTKSPVVMIFSVGILLGLASTSITVNTSPTAVKWFPMKYKGIVSGICTSGMAFSSLYMAPMINALLNNYGVSSTFVYTGIGVMAAILILSNFLPTPPKESDQQAAGIDIYQDDTSLYKNTITPERALLKYETWVMFGCMCCAAMTGQLLTSQVAMIASAQAAWEGGYILVMMLAIGNGCGRILLPTLSDKIGVFNSWKVLSVATFINMILFAFYTTPGTMIFGTIMLGLFYGACVPLTWASVAAVYGKKYLGSIYGYVTTAFGFAAVIGPMIAASVYDASGTYTKAYFVVAGFQVIGFILAFTIKDKPIQRTAEAA